LLALTSEGTTQEIFIFVLYSAIVKPVSSISIPSSLDNNYWNSSARSSSSHPAFRANSKSART